MLREGRLLGEVDLPADCLDVRRLGGVAFSSDCLAEVRFFAEPTLGRDLAGEERFLAEDNRLCCPDDRFLVDEEDDVEGRPLGELNFAGDVTLLDFRDEERPDDVVDFLLGDDCLLVVDTDGPAAGDSAIFRRFANGGGDKSS